MLKFFKRRKKLPAREAVTRVFADALDTKSIDPDANFFELGGDSVQATVVVASLEDAGHVVPSTAVFDFPTVNQLTEFIEEADDSAPSSGAARSIEVLPRKSEEVTSFEASLLQERLWPYERNPDPQRFQLRGEGAALISGELNVDALRSSLTPHGRTA